MISKHLTFYKQTTTGLRVFSLNILRRFTAFLGLAWMQGRKMTHYYKMTIFT